MLSRQNVALVVAGGLVLALAAGCAAIPPQPAPSATVTRFPTSVGAPAAVPETPIATVVAEWNGVPIMPGATSGRQVDGSYIFAVRVGPSEIAEFYTLQMTARGYAAVPGNVMSDDGLFYALRFRRAGESLVITIMPQAAAVEVKIEK